MSFKERLITKFFGNLIEAQVKARVAEVFPYLPTIDEFEEREDLHYRRLTQTEKDLSPIRHDRHLKIAYWLWVTNPLAHRILEMTKDYIVGEGIKYEATDEEVKRVLDKFWDDPINAWDLKQHSRALELGLYGEQIYPVFVNPIDGHVRLGYLDPYQVEAVILNPDNAEVIERIKVKGREEQYRVIRYDDDPDSATYSKLVGDCFYFAVNKVTNASRGFSDLIHIADWLDAYDQLLFNTLEKTAFLNVFLWDILIRGASKETLEKRLQELIKNPPKPGSFRLHNENEEWKAVTPDLKSHEYHEEARLIRTQILSGAGIPEHWITSGEEITRATAAEMSGPVLKRLSARQLYFKKMIEYIFRFVIDQAIIAGTLKESVDKTFKVLVPEISPRDAGAIASILSQVSNALTLASANNWITVDTAASVFALVASQLGVEIDARKEREELAKGITEDYRERIAKKTKR